MYDRLPLTSNFRTNQKDTIIMSSVMFIFGSRGDFSYCLIILELSISVNIHRHQRSTPEKEGIVSNSGSLILYCICICSYTMTRTVSLCQLGSPQCCFERSPCLAWFPPEDGEMWTADRVLSPDHENGSVVYELI